MNYKTIPNVNQELLTVNLEHQENNFCQQMMDKNSLIIYHQNICRLREKTDELISFLYQNFPHILCFSEHHLNQIELKQINIDNYILGANYRRQILFWVHRAFSLVGSETLVTVDSLSKGVEYVFPFLRV
jgi:hypothetical protein